MTGPSEAQPINRTLERLEEAARRQMAKDGIAPERLSLQFSLDMRHKGQINEVEVTLEESRVAGDFQAGLRERFHARYEQLYGRGSSLPGGRRETWGLR